MMKLTCLTIVLLLTCLNAEPLKNNDPALVHDRAKAIHVKKTYLKGAKEKIKKYKKKLDLLKAKKKLTKKNKQQIDFYSKELNKLKFWRAYNKVTASIIEETKKNTREADGKCVELFNKRDALRMNYKKIIGEDFPGTFNAKVHGIVGKLKAQNN